MNRILVHTVGDLIRDMKIPNTLFPRGLEPFYIGSSYINWVKILDIPSVQEVVTHFI